MATTVAPPADATPSPARLLSAPLPELLTETDAEIFESEIADEEFLGAVVQRRDGHLILSLPQGRPAAERDTVARGLLGNALGVKVSPLPAPLEMVQA